MCSPSPDNDELSRSDNKLEHRNKPSTPLKTVAENGSG